VTHIGTPNGTGSWNFQLLKIQDGGRPPSWKIENRPYVWNGSTYLREIWHITATLSTSPISPNKTANIINQKLASVSLHCKSRRSKTANIKILSANSKHRRYLLHFIIGYISTICRLGLGLKIFLFGLVESGSLPKIKVHVTGSLWRFSWRTCGLMTVKI